MVIGLRIVAPNSIRAIEDLIPIVYPDVHVSYGKIQQILTEAEARAAEFNGGCDLSGIEAGALDEMEAAIKAAADRMLTLNHKHCEREGKYIGNRAAGLALYMGEMKNELNVLAERYGETSIRLAGLVFRLTHELQIQNRPWDRRRDEQHLLGAIAMLQDTANEKTPVVLNRVKEVIQRRHRASSAIEGFNAALRPFLYVHKGVTDGFLELFRAYHNLKTRRWGRHKGTSAYECLTGQRVEDWLSKLGYPPADAVRN
jgi:hypothetical protein